MFSGSAVVDHQNSSGLGSGSHPPIILFYTAAGEFVRPKTEYTQCMAFSVDGGLTWNKYDGNPVVQNIRSKNRDPKVIWHQASERWVMALYLERNSYALLTSPNLIDWTQTCDIELPGATECPDFFPLAVDNNPDNLRWVFWGANTTYLVGNFDGQRFYPETAPRKLQPLGRHYAAQTFSNIPESDGRRIMIAWTRQQLPGMPFSQFMSIPHSLQLKNDQNGISLSAEPIRELETIREDSWEIMDQDLTNGVHLEAEIAGELLDVEATINLGKADLAGIVVRGVSVWYDRLNGGLFNGAITSQLSPGLQQLTLRIIADRASVEMFGPIGSTVMTSAGTVMNPSNHTVQFFAVGNGAVVSKARVSRLRSVWDVSTDRD
jgi:sucrose-6-phosphate hydrolase SacC (GH32 family)